MKLTGAEIIWECLQKEGVDVVFGYPGGAILPTYDAMTKYPKIHHVRVRHEQGATHMADGYARATGYRIVRLVSLNEGGGYIAPPQPYPVMAMAKARLAALKLLPSPGMEEVSTITMQFFSGFL